MKHQQNRQQVQQQGQVVVAAAMAVGFLLPAEIKPNRTVKKIDDGQIRIIFFAEESPLENNYRILVANRGYKPGERQWFDADQIPRAIRSLKRAQKMHKKAKRYLEGGILRRVIRIVF